MHPSNLEASPKKRERCIQRPACLLVTTERSQPSAGGGHLHMVEGKSAMLLLCGEETLVLSCPSG